MLKTRERNSILATFGNEHAVVNQEIRVMIMALQDPREVLMAGRINSLHLMKDRLDRTVRIC